MFYGVYYYNTTSKDPSVYLAGFYPTLTEATSRLKCILPNYTQHINNTVATSTHIGWINCYNFGDFNSDLSASQPHSSIDLTSQ
jgi:hypothetical protein